LLIFMLLPISLIFGQEIDYRQEMRKFVQEISTYTKGKKLDFIIIPQNGQELVTTNGESDGPKADAYISAIDGQGREDLFYGAENDNEATKQSDSSYIIDFLNILRQNNKAVLVTDYCVTPRFVRDSYRRNNELGFVSFAANKRDLNAIPSNQPYKMNSADVTSLNSAKNFLYLINPEYSSKREFLNAVNNTNYDLIIIDAFFNDQLLERADINSLKNKRDGGRRLVISYVSIGEAETYRYYWQRKWRPGSPSWLAAENPAWKGNYKVRYWDPAWKKIVYDSPNAYIDKVLSVDFDGVYLDIIDGFEYFENL